MRIPLLSAQQTYTKKILGMSPTPLAYYPLWERAGTVAYDITGHGYNGTYGNITLAQSGIGDGNVAAQWAAANSYMDFYSAAFNTAFNGQEFAVSFWAKLINSSNWTPASNIVPIMIQVDGSNKLHSYNDSGGALYFLYSAGGTAKTPALANALTRMSSTSNWVNFVLAASKTLNLYNVYVNGWLLSTLGSLGSWTGNLNSTLVALGAFNNAGFRAYPATLAHLAIWSGVGSPITQADASKIAWLGNPPRGGVALFFDDGYASQYSTCYAYMQPRGIRGTAYIISDLIGTASYLTSANLVTMDTAGWDIGNHTKDHTNLTTLTEVQQETELTACQAALNGWGVTRAAAHVSYPLGQYNADTLTAMTNTGMSSGRMVSIGNGISYIDLRSANLQYLRTELADNTTALATMQGWINAAVTGNYITGILMHNVGGATDPSAATFQALIDWIVSNNIPTYTITQIVPLVKGTW